MEVSAMLRIFNDYRTIGFVAALSAIAASNAAAGSFTRGCAARDIQLLQVIEEREDSNSLPPEQSADALLGMMNARMICHEGRVLDALAIYDAILQELMPTSVVSKQ
jgi:hypothetical protein